MKTQSVFQVTARMMSVGEDASNARCDDSRPGFEEHVLDSSATQPEKEDVMKGNHGRAGCGERSLVVGREKNIDVVLRQGHRESHLIEPEGCWLPEYPNFYPIPLQIGARRFVRVQEESRLGIDSRGLGDEILHHTADAGLGPSLQLADVHADSHWPEDRTSPYPPRPPTPRGAHLSAKRWILIELLDHAYPCFRRVRAHDHSG